MAALPLVVCHLALLLTFDLAAHPRWTLGWFAVAMASLAYAVRRLRAAGAIGVSAVLMVAALLRLLLLPVPPTLSDDVLRYVWDGRVVAAGENPYRLAPDSPELEPLRDELWSRLPHRDVETVYPPLAMTVFSIAALLPAPVYSLKLLLTACDLLACWILLLLAAALGVSRERTVWYAWSPLATLETAGMGHVDALGVLAVVTAVWLLVTRRGVLLAGVAGAAAVLAKLVPLVALPALARASRRPLALVGVAGVLIVVLLSPVFLAAGGLPPGLAEYGISWEFNGPLYEPLWRLSEAFGVEGVLEERLDTLKLERGDHEFWNRFYPFNYPRLHAKAVLGVLAALGLVWAWRRADPIAALASTFAVVLICSATVYPWYLLWILPWAALREQPAWLALAALLPLSYLPQFGGLPLMPWLFAAIWLPFFALLARYPGWGAGYGPDAAHAPARSAVGAQA